MSLGMLIGTVMPVMGGVIFPWSATAMTLSVAVVFLLTVRKNTVRLTVSNVSPQIFQRIETPMLVLDVKDEITLMNTAAGIFFQLPEERILNHNISDFFDLEARSRVDANQTQDLKCKINGAECRVRLSDLTNTFGEPLGTIAMITDMSDKIRLIDELEMYRNHLQEKLDEKTRDLESLTLQAITAVANTIDAKDEYTKGHSVRVARYASQLARKMGESDQFVSNLGYMALLHDIGKIGVPDSVLNKAGRLNDTEFAIIKQHTTIGADILKDISMVDGVALGARYHHERYDGKGYPSGLKGEEIPYEARIIGIADAFDAMTSSRVYRPRMSMDRVISELEKGAGVQFDPKLVRTFIEMVKAGEINIEENTKTESSIISEANELLVHIMERQNEQTKQEADYDYLTRLYNRKACEREIGASLQKESGVLLLIDLDHFKNVNDTYGHLKGDITLKEVAECLKEEGDENAVIGREGGDEFIVYLRGATSQEDGLAYATAIQKNFELRTAKVQEMAGCTFSIGVSSVSTSSSTLIDLFKQADKALYYVKQTGRNNACAYTHHVEQKEVPQIQRDIDQIVDIFHNTEKYKGAFSVKAQEIKRMYEFSRNFAARYHYEMQIMLFTLEMDLMRSKLEEREETIKLFQTSLKSCLRTVDISTRYGSSQVIVLLMDASDEGVAVVGNKIVQNFYKMHKGPEVAIHYDAVNVKNV